MNALGKRYVKIIQESCVVTEGPKHGQPVELLPWQLKLIDAVTTQGKNGFRKYPNLWVEIPRKNGKSFTLACLVVCHLFTTENPQVVMAAATREQAAILFKYLYDMIALSPRLQQHLEAYRRVIRLKARPGEVRILASDGKSNLGLNPSLICADELLAWSETRGPELYEALSTSMAARDSQMLCITTAGTSYTFGHTLSTHARNVAAGKLEDPYLYPMIFCASEEDDPFSKKTWKKANPSLGHTVRLDYMERMAAKAKTDDASLASFQKLHLNIWAGSAASWVPGWQYQKLKGPQPADLATWDCYLGVDYASVNDFTAYGLLFVNPETREKWAKMIFSITQHGWAKRENAYPDLTREWVRDGWVDVTPGKVSTVRQRMEAITQLIDEYRPVKVLFDPWSAHEIIEAINDRFGKDYAVGVRQTTQFLDGPMKQIYSHANGAKGFSHDGSPVMAWMVGNTHLFEDSKGGWVFHKGKSTEKIDGVAALCTAWAGYIHTESTDSVYNDIDFILGD
jgi:phage terminase large subunit-like protein